MRGELDHFSLPSCLFVLVFPPHRARFIFFKSIESWYLRLEILGRLCTSYRMKCKHLSLAVKGSSKSDSKLSFQLYLLTLLSMHTMLSFHNLSCIRLQNMPTCTSLILHMLFLLRGSRICDPPKMPLLHVEYSELKAVKARWIRKTFISPSTISNNLDRGPGSERKLSPEITLFEKKKTYYEKTLGPYPHPTPAFFFFLLFICLCQVLVVVRGIQHAGSLVDACSCSCGR